MIIVRKLFTPILCASALLLACNGIAQDQKQDLAKPPPYVLPLFDGKDKPPKTPPVGEYKLAPLPNARELFDMVVSCWPEKSWFRGELSADSRVTKRISDSTASSSTSFDPVSGQYTTNVGSGEKFVGLVFRIPLWSAAELDREREREINRRGKIADSVGEFITALAEWQMVERELVLMKSLERRSQERVGLGIAETQEQVKYLEKVASLDRGMVGYRAKLIKSRVSLQGMCDASKSWVVDEYLKRFKDVE
ncbi:MAG: hypothetical protein ACK5A0_15870 [Polaromonas sp.]